MTRFLFAAIALVAPGVASAQSYQCTVPSTVPTPRPDLASASQPQRLRPITGYTLALTWAPQYCHNNARDASAKFECQSGNRFGFTLHGLWPDGVGKEWPQYCTGDRSAAACGDQAESVRDAVGTVAATRMGQAR